MKIFRIILHSIFLLLGVSLLINLSLSSELKNLLILALFIYVTAALSFSVLKEAFLVAFPRHFGMLTVFAYLFYLLITKNFVLFEHNQLILNLTILSIIFTSYFLVSSIIGIRFSFKFRKIKTSSFRKQYFLNYLIFALLIGAFVFFSYSLLKTGKSQHLLYALAILLALFPHLNRNLIRAFSVSFSALSEKLNLNITFNQIGKLAKVKNFVFFKDRFIESGDYRMIDADYRSTVRVITALQLSLQLSEDWNKEYSHLFVRDDYEKINISYDIVEKNDNGITAIDDNAIMYHFGNYSYVKEKIKRENKANLFLLKNEIPIAKYTVNEKIADDKAKLINQLDYFGNTILFDSGTREDLSKDYEIVFDRVYSGLNEKKETELLKELNNKTPTAFFTSKQPNSLTNDISFYITTRTDVKMNEKLVTCSSDSLLNLPKLINHVKKVHAFIKHALYTSFAIQILLLIFAFIYYKNIELILAINIVIALLSEFIIKIFSKKLHWPDQPANLAQSHHAA